MSELILNDEQKEKIKNDLLKNLQKVNNELDSIRDCSSLKDGWGSVRLARKQRKCEELSKKKLAIIDVLFNDFGIEV